MNWNLIAFTALMVFFIVAFLVMLYFQWVDGHVRKWRYEKEMNTTSTKDNQPTVTWVLEAKFKELTDEEILQEWFYKPAEHELWEVKEVLNFARAILRKAQEK